jgi:hypothetical protein
MKKLGSVISYRNKNTKLNVFGTIIGQDFNYFLVAATSGTLDHPELGGVVVNGWVTKHNLGANYDVDPRLRNTYHTKNNRCFWVSRRSKCIGPGFVAYDPKQQGDTDDDI